MAFSLSISEEDAVKWLPVLGRYGAIDDPKVIDFILTFISIAEGQSGQRLQSALLSCHKGVA